MHSIRSVHERTNTQIINTASKMLRVGSQEMVMDERFHSGEDKTAYLRNVEFVYDDGKGETPLTLKGNLEILVVRHDKTLYASLRDITGPLAGYVPDPLELMLTAQYGRLVSGEIRTPIMSM